MFNTNVHPSNIFRLYKVRLQRQQLQDGTPNIPLSSDPEAFSGQMGYI